MDPDPIRGWLRKKRAMKAAASVGLCGISLTAGLVFLFLTFWFVYAIVWVGMTGISAASELLVSKRLALPHGWKLALSGAFVVLLFIGNARTSRDYLADYPRDDYRLFPAIGGGLALVWLLRYPDASTKMISDLLFTGPRLVVGAWDLAARVVRLGRLDLATCGEVLSRLAASNSSISRAEFVPELPEWRWNKVSSDLGLFDGVLLLERNSERLSLTEPLRVELRAMCER